MKRFANWDMIEYPLSEKKDDVKDLEVRQQALENNILLLKSTSDGASGTAETQEILQEKLEEIAAELKTAKAQEAQAAPQSVKENFDRYEKSSEQTHSPGLYQIKKDEETNYNIIFSPYAEHL